MIRFIAFGDTNTLMTRFIAFGDIFLNFKSTGDTYTASHMIVQVGFILITLRR